MNLSGVGVNNSNLLNNTYNAKQPGNTQLPVSNQGAPSKSHFVQGESNRIDQLKDIYDDKSLKKMGIIECATCASRRYVDGSDDAHVSFKTPTHISPEASVSAVMGHEMEHVSHEQSNAKAEGGKVTAQSVSIFMSVCPECGISYASGGVTRTTVVKPVDNEQDKGHLVDLKL